ncbi:MAG: 2'-deoxycytidine 5'-triphosphate deaminase [Rubrimonas sp.]|uniref:2'-deoxycytidine 5'-triphosphate deaminase n=1 Tax=Rubrimonas sp. TaxID=2036015 RepID=UPI002FDC9689
MSDASAAEARPGVLPSQHIRALAASGAIRADRPLDPDQIQPASLDLRLGSRAWRVRASFLPGAGRRVADRLADFAMHEIDLTGGAALETGCVYVVPLMERLDLPADVSGAANAKSSTGRLDLFTRVIADGGVEFDRVEPGYDGPLYAEISPRTFSVLARPGARLAQLRFRRGAARLSDVQLQALHGAAALVDGAATIDDGLAFSVDLKPGEGRPLGWRAKLHSGLIDLDRLDHYDPLEFWEPLRRGPAGGVILDPGAFYILASRESVHVPPDCAAEMAPYLAVAGEFRVHYAGFFDPGFGHAAAGGAGSRAVLEVRCHETPFALEHGQMVGRLVYEPMIETPDILYGSGIGSTYQAQGLRLSKHFRAG